MHQVRLRVAANTAAAAAASGGLTLGAVDNQALAMHPGDLRRWLGHGVAPKLGRPRARITPLGRANALDLGLAGELVLRDLVPLATLELLGRQAGGGLGVEPILNRPVAEVLEVAVAVPGVLPELETAEPLKLGKGPDVELGELVVVQGQGLKPRQIEKGLLANVGQVVVGQLDLLKPLEVAKEKVVEPRDVIVIQEKDAKSHSVVEGATVKLLDLVGGQVDLDDDFKAVEGLLVDGLDHALAKYELLEILELKIEEGHGEQVLNRVAGQVELLGLPGQGRRDRGQVCVLALGGALSRDPYALAGLLLLAAPVLLADALTH